MSGVLLLAPDLARNSIYPPYQVAGALKRLGHDARIAGPSSGPLWPPLVEELQGAVVLGDGWVSLSGWRKALELAEECDLLYAFKAFPTSLGLGLALRKSVDTPLIVHLDDWDAGYFAETSQLRRWVYGIRSLTDPRGHAWLRVCEGMVSWSDGVTVSTRALQRRYGGNVLRQGVDTDRFSPKEFPRIKARRRLGIDDAEAMILFLGTPTPHKGLGSLASLSDEARNALWLIGAGRERWLEAGVDSELLDSARVRGPTSLEEAAWFMAACDIFVIPQSDTEFAGHQLPAKMIHAMSMGCCIVASEVADAAEILGGPEPAGCLVPPSDPSALSAVVQRLLHSSRLRRRFGRTARARATSKYGWDAMASTLTEITAKLGIDGD